MLLLESATDHKLEHKTAMSKAGDVSWLYLYQQNMVLSCAYKYKVPSRQRDNGCVQTHLSRLFARLVHKPKTLGSHPPCGGCPQLCIAKQHVNGLEENMLRTCSPIKMQIACE